MIRWRSCPKMPIDALRGINRGLLAMQVKAEGVREVAGDFDDSVITVFGNQERSNVGYNPKYHGRPSYKETVGIISRTKELVDLTLEEGSHHSNYEFHGFLSGLRHLFPKSGCSNGYVPTGGYDDDNFTYFEDQGYEYIVKAKMTSNMHKVVEWVCGHPDEYKWEQADERASGHAVFHTTDIYISAYARMGKSKKDCHSAENIAV